jgi:protein-arginine kinase activator protein McsA
MERNMKEQIGQEQMENAATVKDEMKKIFE